MYFQFNVFAFVSEYREDKSNSLCSKVYKVQSYEPSSFTNSTTAAANNQAVCFCRTKEFFCVASGV